MYLRFAFKNLFTQKSRTFLTILGISIGIAALVLLLALSEGLKKVLFTNITNKNPLTQITVQTKKQENFLKLLGVDQTKITPAQFEEIKKLSHVTAVYPEMIYQNLSSLQISIWNQTFQTDSMVFGIPYEFIAADIEKSGKNQNIDIQWKDTSEPYPIIISRRIIDLYNFTVAPTNNLPNFSEKDVIGIEFNILLNESTFFPRFNAKTKTVKGKIMGFSDKVNLVGVTLPLEVIRKFNQEENPQYQEGYLRLYVEVDRVENVDKVKAEIFDLQLEPSSSLKEIKTLEENFKVITLSLSLFSSIILLVSGLMIANTFFSSITERKHEIGVLRAVGATRKDIQKIFLTEASLLGFLSGIIGIALGIFCSSIANTFALDALPDFTSKPENLFIQEPFTLLLILVFGIILSLIFAFLPSLKASRIQPLEALMK